MPSARRKPVFLLTFLTLKKVRRLTVRELSVLLLSSATNNKNQSKPRGCAPARRLTFFACAKESKQRNTPEALPCCAGSPAPKRLTTAVRKLGLRLKQFALLIAVNPFGSGSGTRGKGEGQAVSYKL